MTRMFLLRRATSAWMDRDAVPRDYTVLRCWYKKGESTVKMRPDMAVIILSSAWLGSVPVDAMTIF